VSSPTSDFTAAVNIAVTNIVNVLNGSNVNQTLIFFKYFKAVAAYYFDEVASEINITTISDSIKNCGSQVILDHIYNKTDSLDELIELIQNISTTIRILKQVILSIVLIENMHMNNYYVCMYVRIYVCM